MYRDIPQGESMEGQCASPHHNLALNKFSIGLFLGCVLSNKNLIISMTPSVSSKKVLRNARHKKGHHVPLKLISLSTILVTSPDL